MEFPDILGAIAQLNWGTMVQAGGIMIVVAVVWWVLLTWVLKG